MSTNAHQPTMKRFVDKGGADFYPTPAWATHALIDNEEFRGSIWEPACGNGAMSEVLKLTGNSVLSTDLHDYGWGCTDVDFLGDLSFVPSDNIVTNPPFNLAEEFVRKALELANRKVAMLLRLAFLEGQDRAKGLFTTAPPTRVWVFSERITFYPSGIQTAGSGTMAYAWFVWDLKYPTGKTELNWLKPGYKAMHGDKKNEGRNRQTKRTPAVPPLVPNGSGEIPLPEGDMSGVWIPE